MLNTCKVPVNINNRNLLFQYVASGSVSPLDIFISTSFWPDLRNVNPFDTEHRAKITVKFGILREVMLWPSQS